MMNKRKIVVYGLVAAFCVLALFMRQRQGTPSTVAEAPQLTIIPAEGEGDGATEPPVEEVAALVGETTPAENHADVVSAAGRNVQESGSYTSKDDVALYIYLYAHLPGNFITKAEARALGWTGGGLDSYAPGKSIGGDRFSNREGLLPKAAGRTYTECDIDTAGKSSRGAKRIVFSNDGLIYYTEDHYEHFDLLYDRRN